MKHILVLLVSAVLAFNVSAAETKRVCRTTNGKEVCKTIKVHKKVEGAKAVPTAPAKKPAAKPAPKKPVKK